ncbi:MAG: purine-nucleoside phosphorylase [Actinomycetota bacterium]|nr:purine-nucleoside phosphorylase [Actinomycetota bacterium]
MSSVVDITGRSDWRVAVVLGSGISEVAGSLVREGSAAFSDVDGLPEPTVEGHEGRLHWGHVDNVPALVFAGRAHLYEGHDARTVVSSIDAAHDAGCDIFVLTNAAGAISRDVKVGEPCLISDHLNLTGHNPQRGPHDGRGPRFLDLSDVYDARLRDLAKEVDPTLGEGVYAGLAGPTYETPAEIRMLAGLGADLVGMSTVLETIQARYLGGRVLGISIVTNVAAGLADRPLHHEEVAAAGRAAADRLGRLLRGVIASVPEA